MVNGVGGGNNPLEYLKKYAKDNKMSINDAQQDLQSKFGNPQVSQLQTTSVFDLAGGPQKPGDPQGLEGLQGNQNGMSDGKSILDIFKGLGKSQGNEGPQKPGDPQGPQGQDPDAVAKQYAEQKGISLDEAKQELKAKYGDPTKQQQ